MADDPAPPRRRGFWAVLLGTAPGLERLLFASVPAIIAGSLALYWVNGWVGGGVGLSVLAIGVLAARRVGR